MRRLAIAALLLSAALPAVAARPVQFAVEAPSTGALVLPLGSAADLDSRGAMLDAATRAAVGRALTSANFRYRANTTLSLRGLGPYSQILIVGTGSAPLDAAGWQAIGGLGARETAQEDGPVAIAATHLGGADTAAEVGVGSRLGSYTFERYRSSDPENPRRPGRDAPLTVITGDAAAAQAAWRGRGSGLADAVFLARDLINEPANIIYPESFVARTREAFQGVQGVRIRVLDEAEMRRLGMGAILGVGQGSPRPPRMLIVEYRGSGAPASPIVLAGKGITFDSGGITIKPGAGMGAMKGDMAGAASVIAATLSLARAGAPVNVVAIAALAENMPDGAAMRPGDILRAINGRTIEINSTDAEGRLVLADAVAYAEREYRPAAIVDVATLTGAISTALGDEFAGLFSRSDPLAEQLLAAGRATGETLWRMPLHANYAAEMRSTVADIINSATGPGAGLGAHFIGTFVDRTPWAHLDIAGVDNSSSATPTVPAGMVGFGVRLLERFVRDFQPVPSASTPDAG